MKLTVIGCSSGMPSGQSSTSSYLLEANGKSYLLDTGDGTAAAIQKLGIDTNIIENIFISHMHSDHSMGLPLVVQMMKLQKREKRLNVYLPREAEDGFKRLLYMTYLFPDKLGFDIQFTGVERNYEFDDGDIKIEFFQNSHLFAVKEYILKRTIPNRMQCFSMIVTASDKKIIYSADIGSIDDLDPIIENADLLLTEGMHLELEKLPELLIEKKVKKLILTHLQDDTDTDQIKAMFEKSGFSNVDFASDGMTKEI
jgi:ribonuclease BN (tRNA processing enzyme)